MEPPRPALTAVAPDAEGDLTTLGIERQLAAHVAPGTTLLAETGAGWNARGGRGERRRRGACACAWQDRARAGRVAGRRLLCLAVASPRRK